MFMDVSIDRLIRPLRISRSYCWKFFWFGVSAWFGPVLTAQVKTPDPIFRDLTFEELAQITVTTVSRHEETIYLAPAAVSVIDADEIAQLGATNIMDLLRFAPGVQVAQISPAAWGIGIRGFNSQDSRKLLVMRDGRSVYDTLFSGVWWDVQDPLLDDIARIEVVRGPGGALWGANAVNGVVNIITKSARETLGSRVSTTVMDDGLRLASIRHGWAWGRDTFARMAVQERRTGDTSLLAGGEGHNGHRLLSGSFRFDQGNLGENGLTLHGNFHQGRIHQRLQLPVLTAPYSQLFDTDVEVEGASLHARWDRTDASYGTITAQAYFDYFSRGPISLDQRNRTYDFDFQHRTPALGRHALIWGAGFRQISDRLGSPSGNVTFDPPQRTRRLFSAFAQDEITLVPERWRWIVGTKFEHNDYSGWEVQPSARLLFTPQSNLTYWASVSRAVRTPDRTSDFALRLAVLPPAVGVPGSLPTEVLYHGNRALESEALLAFEAGVRIEPTTKLRLEASVFLNDYDRLINFTPGADTPGTNPDRTIRNVGASNQAEGRTSGGELNATWQIRDDWRLNANYSCLHMRLWGPGLPFLDNSAGQNPTTMATLHSAHDLGRGWSLDLMGRHMGKLPSWSVKSYVEMDVHLTWRPFTGFEISLLGRNLLNGDHFEAPSGRTGTPSALVGRSWGAQTNWEF